ncbi:MAG: helix-turn-helix transcriptional regulator [Pseudohongiellaceae bacterium]
MTPQTIGTTIRHARKRLGMRQDELASVAGLSTRSVSAIENGKPTARIGMVLQVLEALDITVSLAPPDVTEP